MIFESIEQMTRYNRGFLSEHILKRLNLNLDVNYYNVRWTNANQMQQFVTYLDEEEDDIGYIVDEQKSRGVKYKNFKEQDILNREEYLWDKSTKFYVIYL